MPFSGPLDDRQLISELIADYRDAVNQRDDVAWGATWAEDAVWSLPFLGLDGIRGDHFFSVGPTTSLFCIGGIGDEPVVRDGRIVVRRTMKTALALDNYVVGGLDGVRLARTFQELLESGSVVRDELDALAIQIPQTRAAQTELAQ